MGLRGARTADVHVDARQAQAILDGPSDGQPIAPELMRARGPYKGSLRGMTYQVPAGTTSQDPNPGPVAVGEKDEEAWTFSFAPTMLPLNALGAPVPIAARITYWQGEASFTTTLNLTSFARRFFTCSARRIETHFYGLTAGATTGGSLIAAVGKGATRSTDFYAWNAGTVLANSTGGQVATGPGVLAQYHAILQTAGAAGTPLWVTFFDSLVAPTGTSTALACGPSDTLFNAGDARSYSDEWSPGVMNWSQGLWAQLSSQPNGYAAPPGGSTFFLASKVGS